MREEPSDDELPDDGLDSDDVRAWISRAGTVVGIGIPVALVTLTLIDGGSVESAIWMGIMGTMLGLILMHGLSPQSFSLFPPGRRRRRRRR